MEKELDLAVLVQPAIDWYKQNRRDLPWRKDKNPYHIWVSEIMLQQTRVEAVIPYYHRFMEALPNIDALADCEEDRLLKLWEGLGYYNRVRNMQKAARRIGSDFSGQMPTDYETILQLPGIGPYTAGAIASIAFDERVPAVDGNVLRILMRVLGDASDIAKEQTKKKVTAALQKVMPAESGTLNQALMEIGACVCVPGGKPHCEVCPWQKFCYTARHDCWQKLPVKSKPGARRIEQRTVLIIRDGEQVLLRKRPATGLLAGLYEVPNLVGTLREEDALVFARGCNLAPLYIETLPEAKHIFSHIEWRMHAYLIQVADVESFSPEISEGEETAKGYFFAKRQDVEAHYAVPSAFSAYSSYLR